MIGTPDSGRRSIVRDLAENGFSEQEKLLVLVADSEAPAASDVALAKLKHISVAKWSWVSEGFSATLTGEHSCVFFLADPRVSPIDQLEFLKPWLVAQNAELARVFCVVDCQLASKQPALRLWYEACVHFADVVFLARREGVENKWLSDFIAHFKNQCFPCYFIYVKKGDLPNPALLLDPTPRRVSQYFDEADPVYEIEGLETDDEENEGEEDGLTPEEPYFARQRSGRREKELPDICDYLEK